MERKVIVPELIVIRALACLSVVMLHSITLVSGGASRRLYIAQLFLLFATPTFAYMSPFLIGFSKKKRSFGETIRSRVKYLILPFLFFAVFYAAWQSYQWGIPFLDRVWYNVKGGYHGYFVLVVMQFYLFHPLFRGILERVPAGVAVPVAGLVNIGYLAVLNLRLVTLPYLGFNWYHFFPAWAFYYVLGYYSGRDRDQFQTALRRNWPFAAALLVGAGIMLLRNTLSGFMPDLTSQRFDVLLYAAGIILLAFPLAGQIRRVPAVLNHINRASFGIYLLHWFFLEFFRRWVLQIPSLPRVAAVLILFVLATLASTLVTYALNRWKWGAFVVGRLGVDGRKGQPEPPTAAAAGSQ